MEHQNTDMDTESLQKRERRRGSCLDVFLVVSIIFLFAAVVTVAAGGVMIMMELRSKVDSSSPSSESMTSTLTGDTPSPAYKMQNYAYLEATSSVLKNYTMSFAAVKYGLGQSVGSNFVFDSNKQSLQVKRTGTYFMYIDLKLTCTSTCNTGLLRVRLDKDLLTCEVELSAEDPTPKSRKCWTVSQIHENTPLLAQMEIPKEGLKNWKLELNSSKFGVFLVD
ncbi:uncharacterized protein LOC128366209 [Scomber japonicus]|uniref:uncharacterized protein LOC128366209 n=1 Tax=Scomber japonicus TaxID=13676 RepID=UPI002306BA3E|nr:uncharacterized protein LOC128366209 [Scomber japonicus]